MLSTRVLFCCLLSGPLFANPLQAETAEQTYLRFAARPAVGACIDVDIDLQGSPGFSADSVDGGVELRYRMAFNNIAEGWSWQPNVNPESGDYYRFKFLPLQSVLEERGTYPGEDKLGETQTMSVRWRYDYFLAFENLYEFYARTADDDAGFVARIGKRQLEHPGLRARACLSEPVTSESTTFWKATHARPVDFTLKKRYLVGTLQALYFFDRDTGEDLAVLSPGVAKCLICPK